MKEVKGDFWKFVKYADAICVTTNGIVKANGELVMGKGIALDFAQRYPELPAHLGRLVSQAGNQVYLAYPKIKLATQPENQWAIFSFPTKHHWRDKSDLSLIAESAKQLVHLTNITQLKKVLLTRPGCGNGGLDWEREVKPAIQNILDDRFVIVSPM